MIMVVTKTSWLQSQGSVRWVVWLSSLDIDQSLSHIKVILVNIDLSLMVFPSSHGIHMGMGWGSLGLWFEPFSENLLHPTTSRLCLTKYPDRIYTVLQCNSLQVFWREGVLAVVAASKYVEMSRRLLPLKPGKGQPQLVQLSMPVIHIGHNEVKNIFSSFNWRPDFSQFSPYSVRPNLLTLCSDWTFKFHFPKNSIPDSLKWFRFSLNVQIYKF